MKATSFLRQQQQRLKGLLASLAHDRHAAAPLVARVIEDVLVHMTLEESICSGLARRSGAEPGAPVSATAAAAMSVRSALVALAAAAPGSSELAAAARDLRGCFEERVAFELEELLPQMEQAYDDAELELIGRTIERCYSNAQGSALL